MSLQDNNVFMNFIRPKNDDASSEGLVQHITSMDLYNLLQEISSKLIVIIDLRPRDQFDKLHVKTAVNLPPPTHLTKQQLGKFNMSKYIGEHVTVKYWNLVFHQTILYSDKPFLYDVDEIDTFYRNGNNNNISNNNNDLPETIDLKLDNWDYEVFKFMVAKRRKITITIFQEGFNRFKSLYGFQCVPESKDHLEKRKLEADKYPSEIVEGFIYLGGADNAHSRVQLQNLKITYIVNMAKEINDLYAHIYKYYRANLEDNPKANILDHFEPIFKFMDEAKEKNTGVLVHCAMGISRSATVVIAYLMRNGLSYQEAYKLVKFKRSMIHPNHGFYRTLQDYDKTLTQSKLISNNDNLNIVTTSTDKEISNSNNIVNNNNPKLVPPISSL
eukprot:gene2190-2693_t